MSQISCARCSNQWGKPMSKGHGIAGSTRNSTASAPMDTWTRPRPCSGKWTWSGTWSNWIACGLKAPDPFTSADIVTICREIEAENRLELCYAGLGRLFRR